MCRPPAISPHQWYYVKMEFKDTVWVMTSRPWSYATGVNCFPDNPWPVTAQSVQVQEWHHRPTAELPGVTLIPETTDMTGRAGFGIALTDSAGLQNEWILGKDTYTFPRHAEHAGHGGTRLRCHRRRGRHQNRHIVPRPRARHLDRGARHLRPRTQGRHAPRRDRDRGARRGELAWR